MVAPSEGNPPIGAAMRRGCLRTTTRATAKRCPRLPRWGTLAHDGGPGQPRGGSVNSAKSPRAKPQLRGALPGLPTTLWSCQGMSRGKVRTVGLATTPKQDPPIEPALCLHYVVLWRASG
eukprot:14999477-Alexandrium_andersonii.AAC.1